MTKRTAKTLKLPPNSQPPGIVSLTDRTGTLGDRTGTLGDQTGTLGDRKPNPAFATLTSGHFLSAT